jgi:hypothetical protein
MQVLHDQLEALLAGNSAISFQNDYFTFSAATALKDTKK